jgi:hypothetical protein
MIVITLREEAVSVANCIHLCHNVLQQRLQYPPSPIISELDWCTDGTLSLQMMSATTVPFG